MPQTSSFNQRAASASSVFAAVAVVLAAAIMVVELRAARSETLPIGPRELAFADSETSVPLVAYETQAIQDRAEPALDQITYDWEGNLDGWTIQFLGPNGRVAGYTWSEQRKIEVFVKDDADVDRITRILAHELGHAVDVTLNTGDERREWLASRGIEDTPWWPSSGSADFQTGAGDFAEVFAAWEVGPSDFRSEVGSAPTPEDLELIARLSAG